MTLDLSTLVCSSAHAAILTGEHGKIAGARARWTGLPSKVWLSISVSADFRAETLPRALGRPHSETRCGETADSNPNSKYPTLATEGNLER